jgi:hypothetical protein
VDAKQCTCFVPPPGFSCDSVVSNLTLCRGFRHFAPAQSVRIPPPPPDFARLRRASSRQAKRVHFVRSLARRSVCRCWSNAKADQFFGWLSFLSALRSRRLHYFSMAARLVSVPVSNNLIAASSAAGLRCMYRCVVPKSWCPASS